MTKERETRCEAVVMFVHHTKEFEGERVERE
jgi:hypothetical protein